MSQSNNWPGGVNYGHSNFTGKTPRVSKYDGQGHWAPNSSTPPGGWLPVIAGTAVVMVIAGAVMYIGAAVGF
ncbi:hypothetical protein [Eoetvoesiella caeni]|uniref:Uncharacterized protein n=1 Tax=Eoetvoesiella caeni TaxID=645616 RepID=A0A366HBK8_9BURK|nr:hypothetical protein [Eoetvoesiella caeni]MCI2809353.1 hypothetical protein [Eoetvoesiella caeni]NYT54494.1 hypothetical protein [Eoetvoesiella caeni]RBP39318.1 hypothetical protein DFR37_105110 [Eoetvoesiella caeni]